MGDNLYLDEIPSPSDWLFETVLLSLALNWVTIKMLRLGVRNGVALGRTMTIFLEDSSHLSFAGLV